MRQPVKIFSALIGLTAEQQNGSSSALLAFNIVNGVSGPLFRFFGGVMIFAFLLFAFLAQVFLFYLSVLV